MTGYVYRPRVEILSRIETARIKADVLEHRLAALDRRMSYSNSSACAQARDVKAWERFAR